MLSKVAVQKTAGVLGDDLALNAQQLTGVNAHRELPVVLAVAQGSVINKAILVPAALLLCALLPWLVLPLLMIGGAYLCYEGAEKLLHKFLHRHEEEEAEQAERVTATSDPNDDMVAFEKEKIAGLCARTLSCRLRSSSSRWARSKTSLHAAHLCDDCHRRGDDAGRIRFGRRHHQVG